MNLLQILDFNDMAIVWGVGGCWPYHSSFGNLRGHITQLKYDFINTSLSMDGDG